MGDIDADVRARFRAEMALLSMTVAHDEGLYRHVRFRRAEQSCEAARPHTRSEFWFDLITVPGSLIFRGDGDAWVFSRVEDMFEFFRSDKDINPYYWAQKVVSGRDRIMRYDPQLFVQAVKEHVADEIRGGNAPVGISRAVRDDIFDNSDVVEFEENARRALDEFEFKGFQFHDWWDMSFHDYDWWFLWSCHAIRAGINAYDLYKLEVAV